MQAAASAAIESASPTQSPMKKIITLVGVAIVIFLVFITFSVTSSVSNNARLADIRALYFPVLERMDANVVRLDTFVERMTQGVMTAEEDEVDAAMELAEVADKAFAEIEKLYPARGEQIRTLRSGFAAYAELARKTSLGFIQEDANAAADMGRMNEALEQLRADLADFRSTSYDNFLETLEASRSSANQGMWLGILVGVMNLGFIGVLVYFIRNNVRMMGVIAEQNATLERRVAERTAQLAQKTSDINAMLHNMSLGVCTIVPGNRIHPEFSNHMKTIFEQDEFADASIGDILFRRSTVGVDARDQVVVGLDAIIGEDAMMWDFNSHVLLREIELRDGDTHKILQLDWSPIVNPEDAVEKVLLIVQDVTHLRALEAESAQQKEELDIIAQILRISIGKFNDFIASAHKFVAENRRLLQETGGRDLDVIAALFRNMHTIKGNARTYEFTLITNAAHAAEQEYDRLRKDDQAEWDAARMLAELDAVEAAIARYESINEDKLGRKGRASDLLTTRGVFIGNEELEQLRKLTRAVLSHQAPEEADQLRSLVGNLGLIPLSRLVSGAADSVASLARELGKPTPEVVVDGEAGFNNRFAESLKSALMHVMRNSLDHGIESVEQRRAAGKADAGSIRFACRTDGDAVELTIGDDGRGLALHKLYEKGLAAGRFAPDVAVNPGSVAELIFASGLSTAEQVTQVSGRGVGMDAVRAFLAEHGATIAIDLAQSSQPLGFTPFRFVIRVPRSACQASGAE